VALRRRRERGRILQQYEFCEDNIIIMTHLDIRGRQQFFNVDYPVSLFLFFVFLDLLGHFAVPPP